MTEIPSTAQSYEETPYPSLSYVQSHPDRLATIAKVLGLSPPPVERSRVLELGCAGAGNLVPMAYGLPGSEFVGMDYAERQITEGRELVAALGLANVTLECRDILDLGDDLGTFDYIIAHGVYSWVPGPVRDRLLALCNQTLSPHGVAYISYNTYPGWHFLGAMREMMLYHTRHVTDPLQKARQARELLDLLAEAVPPDSGSYGSFLSTYARFLSGELKGEDARGDAFLLHDELEDVNDPVYFSQFIEHAAQHGLRYLGEAEFSAMTADHFDADAFRRIDEMATSVVDLEQYMDFMRNRTFRQTLLCRAEAEVSRTLDPRRLSGMYVASHARPVEPILDLHGPEIAQFKGTDGASFSTDHPVSKAAMRYLEQVWPQAVPFDELVEIARAQAGARAEEGASELDADRDLLVLGVNLLKAYSYSSTLVKLHACPPNLVSVAGERPLASALARHQASSGSLVTNLRHERVQLKPLDVHLLQGLDGSRDRAALVERMLHGPVAEGWVALEREGAPVVDETDVLALLAEDVDQRLAWLASAALLEK